MSKVIDTSIMIKNFTSKYFLGTFIDYIPIERFDIYRRSPTFWCRHQLLAQYRQRATEQTDGFSTPILT
jgi:hypothetical protein